MDTHTCADYLNLLVDYADETLAPPEQARMATHLEQCGTCRRRVAALRRSLTVAQEIWSEAEVQLAQTGSSGLRRRTAGRARVHLLSMHTAATALAAAAALFAAFVLPQQFETQPQPTPVARLASAQARLEAEIRAAGLAQQMLVAGRWLAEIPGGAPYAAECFKSITTHYGDTDAAREARAGLAALPEG